MKQFELFWCFKEIWRHIGKIRRRQLAMVLLLMVVVAGFEILTIGAILPFLGVLVSPEKLFAYPALGPLKVLFNITSPQDLVRPMMLGFAAVVVVVTCLRILLLVLQTRISQNIGLDLGASIYRNRLYLPYAVHVKSNSSDVIAGIWKADTVVGSFVYPLLSIVSAALLICLAIPTLMLIAGWTLIILALAVLCIYACIARVSHKRVHGYSCVVSTSQNRVLQIMQEGLGGIRDVLIDGSQRFFADAYLRSDSDRRRAMSALQVVSTAPKFLMESLGMLVIVVLVLMLTERKGLAESIPVLGAIVLGVQRILPSAQLAYSSWTTIRGGYASILDVLNLLNEPLIELQRDGQDKLLPFHESIELRDVSFSYAVHSAPVLKNINLLIHKGMHLGLVGGTGGGKSTLVDLILGLLEPSNGQLLIDGKPLSPELVPAWMSRIAHVPQTIFLADASIAENIAFGIPLSEIDLSRVREAARMARISNDIEAWDDQYATRVGERGCRLSGGQRQRVGIARALYKKADVLVFDEATSALDSETEQLLMETINDLGSELTVISIAHRLSTLKSCDLIVELEGGSFAKKMTFEQMTA